MKIKNFAQFINESEYHKVDVTVEEYAVAINGKVYWGDLIASVEAEYEPADPEVGIMSGGWLPTSWEVTGTSDVGLFEVLDEGLFAKLQAITFNKVSPEEESDEAWLQTLGFTEKMTDDSAEKCRDLLYEIVYESPDRDLVLRKLSTREVSALAPIIDKITVDPNKNNTLTEFDPFKDFNDKVTDEFDNLDLDSYDDRDYAERDYEDYDQ